jgi:hypothetical protein
VIPKAVTPLIFCETTLKTAKGQAKIFMEKQNIITEAVNVEGNIWDEKEVWASKKTPKLKKQSKKFEGYFQKQTKEFKNKFNQTLINIVPEGNLQPKAEIGISQPNAETVISQYNAEHDVESQLDAETGSSELKAEPEENSYFKVRHLESKVFSEMKAVTSNSLSTTTTEMDLLPGITSSTMIEHNNKSGSNLRNIINEVSNVDILSNTNEILDSNTEAKLVMEKTLYNMKRSRKIYLFEKDINSLQ